MNWAKTDVPWININVFVLLLAASRFRIYRLSLTKTQDVLLSFLDDAFETFGGVPSELLTDNMKTVMDEPRTEYNKLVYMISELIPLNATYYQGNIPSKH